ncbi:MAG: signal peptidase II [Treponema sp.]|jgi:signal peptidase II|nr:signal peptidase II [Treponema sp.]
MAVPKDRLKPFLLTGLLILADQGIKAYITRYWPQAGSFIMDVFNNELVWIIHVRNKAIAFSLGHNLPDAVKPFLFILIPLGVLGFLVYYAIRSAELSALQRWTLAGIAGGGIGNLLDRVFRPDGVVDFISVKFYGILGFDRWPTFNIADSGVVVCGILFLCAVLFQRPEKKRPAG